MLAPSRRWLSRPKTLLFFALCAAALYFFLINGSNGRYPGAWSAGSGGKNHPESSPPTHEQPVEQPVDVVEDAKTDDSPEISTENPSADGSQETVSEEDNSPSLKNKDDELREEYEKEFAELGK